MGELFKVLALTHRHLERVPGLPRPASRSARTETMFIEAPELASYPEPAARLLHPAGRRSEGIYASLNGGLGSSDDPARVAENRRRMAESSASRPTALVSVHQVHSPDAVIVEGPWTASGRRPTEWRPQRPGIALAITTADCGPVLFADPHAGVIGAAHAGWRGALTGVLEATIDGHGATRRAARQDRRRARADDQPGGLRGRPDFVTRFAEAEPGNGRFFRSERASGPCAVRSARLYRHAARAGRDRTNSPISVCAPIRTRSASSAIAARRTAREPDYGRLISAIALTP